MLKAPLPLKGDFLQSQTLSPRYPLQTSQDYHSSYFPWKSFHTMHAAKSGSPALPHLHLQGWELPSTSNSLLFWCLLDRPWLPELMILGKNPTFIYFFFHRFLPLQDKERSFKLSFQGITSWDPQAPLTLCFCPSWDLHCFHSVGLRAGPIPGYLQM